MAVMPPFTPSFHYDSVYIISCDLLCHCKFNQSVSMDVLYHAHNIIYDDVVVL